MQKYELSLYDFEALKKVMDNVLGNKITQLTAQDISVIDQLRDRFEAAHTAWIETEE